MGASFKIEKKLGKSRAGVFSTSHGDIKTPSFVVVGTKATVKAIIPEMLENTQVVLANSYHLYLQPGDQLIKEAGGLNKFMNWQGPTMTDSGGFQVFSLGAAYGKGISKVIKPIDPSLQITERSSADDGVPRLATIGNDGVSFRSHLDGSLHYFTPEKSMEIQHNLGADIIFAFDECTSPTEDERYQEEALSRTHAWAKRSLEYHKSKNTGQALFGIVQGGRSEKLRKKSAEVIGSMNFDGFGIGGSFNKDDMSTAVKWVNDVLPEEKPRHLLGIGEPEDLFMGVENGVDFFDCVAPTRIGRNGSVYTYSGKINLNNAKFINDFDKIDDCECYTCQNYTKAYLSHLFRGKEMLAATLASIHNVYFINKLLSDMRQAILDENFNEFREEFLRKYKRP
ncbi:MAG: tRNA guanosine(34) transglycosylase Tgt [Patescibacteria group bacterium]|nr:tRNA guanosine(34) transglycosylase Tgt [Patescibacteria group bacterium]